MFKIFISRNEMKESFVPKSREARGQDNPAGPGADQGPAKRTDIPPVYFQIFFYFFSS